MFEFALFSCISEKTVLSVAASIPEAIKIFFLFQKMQ